MPDDAREDRKTTVLARVERLRELIEEDAEAPAIERAYHEIGRVLEGLNRTDRSDNDSSIVASDGEAPPDL
jgi:hypothetical protein